MAEATIRGTVWELVEKYGYQVHAWPPRPGIPRWTIILSDSGVLPTVRAESERLLDCLVELRTRIEAEAARLV